MPKRIDKNQPEITAALRGVGASVEFLHTLGKGVPDLLVGFRGCNYLLEVKDGSLSESRKQLTDDERDWHAAWHGRVHTVENVDQALAAIGAVRSLAPHVSGRELVNHGLHTDCQLRGPHFMKRCGIFSRMELLNVRN